MDNQGKEYLKYRTIRSKQEKKSSKSNPSKNCLEGFDNRPVEKVNTEEINGMKSLQNSLYREMQNYTTIFNNLMNNTKGYLEASAGQNENRGKNVNIGGKYGYITQEGLFKEYPSETIGNDTAGLNNCPGGWNSGSVVDNTFPINFSNQMFESIPGTNPLINGSEMQSGQGCGLEGSNVFVSQPQASVGQFIDTYNSISGSDMQEQTDLGQTSYQECLRRSSLRNKDYFVLSNFDGNNGKCFIGNNKDSIVNSGLATKDVVVKNVVPAPGNAANSYMTMGNDGVLYSNSDVNTYWNSSNTPIDGCNRYNGGYMFLGDGSGASATYGQNCSDWGIKSNRSEAGLAGPEPLPGSLQRLKNSGIKNL